MEWFSRTLQLSALALLVGTAGVGCGRANKVYPDRSSVGTPATGEVSVDGRDLPRGFANQSANSGSVVLNANKELELKTLSGSADEGAFNGSGNGNLAVLGLTQYDQTRLSDLANFNVELKSTFGDALPSALILVDLECGDTARVRALFAEELSVKTKEFSRHNLGTKSSIWKVKGSDLKDANDQILVSSNSNGSLEKLIAAYPNACLRNLASNLASPEDALPKLPLSGVMFTLGGPSEVDQNHVVIRRIEIGSQVFETANWGSL